MNFLGLNQQFNKLHVSTCVRLTDRFYHKSADGPRYPNLERMWVKYYSKDRDMFARMIRLSCNQFDRAWYGGPGS